MGVGCFALGSVLRKGEEVEVDEDVGAEVGAVEADAGDGEELDVRRVDGDVDEVEVDGVGDVAVDVVEENDARDGGYIRSDVGGYRYRYKSTSTFS